MKKLALALVLVAGMVATASAADRAVSKSTLSSMGLSSMQVMSDHDGLAVRGKGTFAKVWGGSSANFHGQHSANNYAAGSNKWFGASGASGGSVSFAGVVGGMGSGNGFVIGGMGGVAGGGATAKAW
jgi:hypothetical protein